MIIFIKPRLTQVLIAGKENIKDKLRFVQLQMSEEEKYE